MIFRFLVFVKTSAKTLNQTEGLKPKTKDLTSNVNRYQKGT